ncbi:hypothetical protein GPECTOR_63g3 [Gonium pectorale]|uniref:Dynein heavy chain coiled coil stalk domain-containing protein n=1 Tax=Gonium pectorale TaxID=33097 RepID=A0A150G4B0_GONPE|nr:hypothetical protein GPECTOR_63g3 [Gonium pectorale]|eukprot:KXZ44702.1 hypothetical protein GPECTOR_63g3 [Gonium pectorale]
MRGWGETGEALDTIRASDVRLVATFKSPPAAVKLVMEAVCVMLDVPPSLYPDPNMAGRKLADYWDASKKLLLDPATLLTRLREYDKDAIPQRIMDKIRREYTGDPDFTPAAAAKASSAAEGLCKWVHAMDQYDRVAKVVAPKRAALEEAEGRYGGLLAGLRSKQAELEALEARLAALQGRLAESQERKARLEVLSSAAHASQLAGLEGRILELLSGGGAGGGGAEGQGQAEGRLLEDGAAVEMLREAKRLADDISSKQAAADRTQSVLESARRRYRPVAQLAATTFFALSELAAVGPCYVYGLDWFVGLFVRSILDSAAEAPGPGGPERPASPSKVTDPSDRLLLGAMLRRVLSPRVAEAGPAAEGGDASSAVLLLVDPEGAAGSPSAGSGGAAGGSLTALRLPEDVSLQGLQSYVEGLPPAAAPEALGLHANADISRDLATSDALLASLAATCGSGTGGGGGGASSAAAAGALVARELLSSLPPDFDLEAAAAAAPVLYSQSLNGVLLSELGRYNGLLGRLRGSLQQLGDAAAGRQLLGPELEGLAADLEAGRMPAAWKAASYPSLKPLGSYVADLTQRLAFLRAWLEGGIPPSFWLGALFFPHALLTAVLQNFTRHHSLPIDLVGFEYEVLRPQDVAGRLSSPPPSGIHVTGLHLEGAGWDEALGCLAEAAPGQLSAPLPPVWFRPTRLAEGQGSRPWSAAPTASLPVYLTAARRGDLSTTGHSSNHLLSMRLPMLVARGAGRGSDADDLRAAAEHWVLRGAAVLVSLPD